MIPPADRRSPLRRKRTLLLFVAALAVAAWTTSAARSFDDWRADLEDPDPFTRSVAALALSELGGGDDADLVAHLCDAVDSSSEILREPARRALSRVASRSSEAVLTTLTVEHGASRSARAAISDALVAAGSASRPALLAALRSRATFNPRAIAKLVARQGADGCADLARVLREDADFRPRAAAAWALADGGSAAHVAVPDLLHALAADASWVAGPAARALARIAPHEREVERALHDARTARADIRHDAGEALALVVLEHATIRPRESVVRLCALGDDALAPCVDALADRRAPVARAAAELVCAHALALACGFPRPSAIDDLLHAPRGRQVEALSYGETRGRALVALALGAGGSRSLVHVPLLAAFALDRDPRASTTAHVALSSIALDLVVDAVRLGASR